jgi:hypothetical protein
MKTQSKTTRRPKKGRPQKVSGKKKKTQSKTTQRPKKGRPQKVSAKKKKTQSKTTQRPKKGRPQKVSAQPKMVSIKVAAKPAAAAAKGCCTIASPGAPDRAVAGVTQPECIAIQNAHPGSAAHWVKGSCA